MVPKARQPRWQIAPCAQHAVAVAVALAVILNTVKDPEEARQQQPCGSFNQ